MKIQLKKIILKDNILRISFFILTVLLVLILIRSVLMSFHLSTALIQPVISVAYFILIPISILFILVKAIQFIICLFRVPCRRLRQYIIHLSFFLLAFGLLLTLLFNTGSSWVLSLINETNKDVVFNTDYCPIRGSEMKLAVPKNSTRYFYCNSNEVLCSNGSGRNICVDGIGCGIITHGSCTGFLGGEAKSVTISTAKLSKYRDPVWLSTLDKLSKAEAFKTFNVNSYALAKMSEVLRDDRELVLASVSKAGDTLQYASSRLQDDKVVVLKAVKQLGGALYYASDRLKGDKEVVSEAVKDYFGAFDYASGLLKNDREFILELLQQGGRLCLLFRLNSEKIVKLLWLPLKGLVLRLYMRVMI